MVKRLELITILSKYEKIAIDDLVLLLKLDKKRIWYELSEINELLNFIKISPLRMKSNHIYISNNFRKNVDLIVQELNENYSFIPKDIRPHFILLYLFLEEPPVSVTHLKQMLKVSRNTVLNEIKILRKTLIDKNLDIIYSRERGYEVIGPEISIRSILEISVNELFSTDSGQIYFKKFLEKFNMQPSIEDLVVTTNGLFTEYEVELVAERYEEFIYLFVIRLNSDLPAIKLEKNVIEEFRGIPLRKLAEDLCKTYEIYDDHNITYVLILLLASLQGNTDMTTDDELFKMTKEIVENLNRLTLGTYSMYLNKDLNETLFKHLVPAYYRLKFNIPLTNPYTERIKYEYLELFDLVKRSLKPLEHAVDKSIPDSEVAYFTIHFGGYIRRYEYERTMKAVAVCPHGISSSLLLKSQLKNIFPDLNIVGIYNSKDLLKEDTVDYDMVFSTIPILTEKPTFVMKPIMNWMEREVLIKQVKEKFDLKTIHKSPRFSEILQIIERHTIIEDRNSLYQDLGNLLYKYEGGIPLEELLNRSLMQITDEKMSWEEAIEFAAKPLLNQNYIQESYVEAMINNVKESGSYIVIAPKVAIPHARPEDGTNKLGISFLKLEHPVQFDLEDSDKDVQIIFVLSSVDNSSHLRALQELSNLLEDQKNIDEMIEIHDLDTMLDYILNKSKGVNVE